MGNPDQCAQSNQASDPNYLSYYLKQIECRLGPMRIFARRLSVKVDSQFQYALEKRIDAAKAMAEASGPLNAYADDFLPPIENIGF